jgi:hypothetical protein
MLQQVEHQPPARGIDSRLANGVVPPGYRQGDQGFHPGDTAALIPLWDEAMRELRDSRAEVKACREEAELWRQTVDGLRSDLRWGGVFAGVLVLVCVLTYLLRRK